MVLSNEMTEVVMERTLGWDLDSNCGSPTGLERSYLQKGR